MRSLAKTLHFEAMPRKPTDISTVNELWEFYKKEQTARYVLDRAENAGIKISARTVGTLINNGFPARGIVSFKQRLRELQEATTQVLDKVIVSTAVADVDGWRRLVDQGQVVVAMLLDRAHERLKPQTKTVRDKETGERKEEVVPLSAKDLRAAAEAVKVAFSSMKQAAETHDIWNLQSGSEVDGWDMMMKEHMEAFTEEERVALRDRGVWPDRIPLPVWLGGGEGEEETDGDES